VSICEVVVAFSAECQIGTPMRKTLIVVASLACAFAAKADYVIKQTIENAGKTREVEIKIKDTKFRRTKTAHSLIQKPAKKPYSFISKRLL
jgi:hypothetical protein